MTPRVLDKTILALGCVAMATSTVFSMVIMNKLNKLKVKVSSL
jgi:hypothetical protein